MYRGTGGLYRGLTVHHLCRVGPPLMVPILYEAKIKLYQPTKKNLLQNQEQTSSVLRRRH
jgi:hypothetical protein